MENQADEEREILMALARRAGLDIPPERTSEVAAILRAWTAEAAILAERMSASRFDTVLPITTFSHPAGSEGDET